MVATPWGASDSLRDRRPRSGATPEQVGRNQRNRLFGAMVAAVSERGYAATRVADLVQISGVSRRTFYDHFADKQACFQATVEALLAAALQGGLGSAEGTWEEQVRSRAQLFAELILAQPAAARLCLIEAYAAGPAALKPIEDAIATFEALSLRRASATPGRADLPPELITASVGAILEITRTRLRAGREGELPKLMEELSTVLMGYRPPPQKLEMAVRPRAHGPEALDAHDHAERAMRAFATVVAERGYADTTIEQVVKRGSMSQTTFYSHFQGKDDAMLATIDSAGAQIVAAILPAFRRNPDWPNAVRAAFGALFNFLASRPAMAHLLMVEVYAAGSTAVERREEAMRPLEMIWTSARRLAPEVPGVAYEAIIDGIYALAYRHIRDSGPGSLPGLAPVCTYIALAPFIDAEQASTVASGDGQARAAAPGSAEAIRAVSTEPTMQEALSRLTQGRAVSLQTIAKEINEPEDVVRATLERLERAGLAEFIEERQVNGVVEDFYRSHMGVLYTDEWERLSLPEREKISTQIGHLIKGDVDRAIDERTFDARSDRGLTRVALRCDERGWQELSKLHTDMTRAIIEMQARCSQRLDENGEQGFPARQILALFEMPGP